MILLARPEEVDGIAAVHARAWQGAYPGILPASTLQAFTVDSRRKYWSGVRLDDPAGERPVFVAVEGDSAVGFAVCGRPRDRDMPFDAELYALNVDRATGVAGSAAACLRIVSTILQDPALATSISGS